MEKKYNSVITLILLIIILCLIGYILFNKLYIKTDNNSNNNIIDNTISVTSKTYNYNDIAGTYYIEKDFTIDDEIVNGNFHIFLWNDGTFKTDYCLRTCLGNVGNYTIVENTIKLNYLFSTNSGAGINVTTGNNTLTIDENGNISSTTLNEYEDFSGTLIKDTNNKYTYQYNGLNEIINNEIIYNSKFNIYD